MKTLQNNKGNSCYINDASKCKYLEDFHCFVILVVVASVSVGFKKEKKMIVANLQLDFVLSLIIRGWGCNLQKNRIFK
jgi:hypothetical protein